MVAKQNKNTGLTWYTMDLHLHTPASDDYLQPEIGYLDILQQAAIKGLDIIAFTDHNTVAGYRRMQEEIDQLKLLQKLNRAFLGRIVGEFVAFQIGLVAGQRSHGSAGNCLAHCSQSDPRRTRRIAVTTPCANAG